MKDYRIRKETTRSGTLYYIEKCYPSSQNHEVWEDVDTGVLHPEYYTEDIETAKLLIDSFRKAEKLNEVIETEIIEY